MITVRDSNKKWHNFRKEFLRKYIQNDPFYDKKANKCKKEYLMKKVKA